MWSTRNILLSEFYRVLSNNIIRGLKILSYRLGEDAVNALDSMVISGVTFSPER